MSVSRLTDQIATAWGSYIIDFNALFRFHKVETGRPECFSHLASLLGSREALRSDFFRLADSIKRGDGTLSDADLLSIVALAIGGPEVAAGGDLAVPLSLLSIVSAGLHGRGTGFAEDFGSSEVATFRGRSIEPEPDSNVALRPVEVSAQAAPEGAIEEALTAGSDAFAAAAISSRSIYQALLASAQRDSIAHQDLIVHCDGDVAGGRDSSVGRGMLGSAIFDTSEHDAREQDRIEENVAEEADVLPVAECAEADLRSPALQGEAPLGPTLAAVSPYLAPGVDGFFEAGQTTDLMAWPEAEGVAEAVADSTRVDSLSLAPWHVASMAPVSSSLSPGAGAGSRTGSGAGLGLSSRASAGFRSLPVQAGTPTPPPVTPFTPDLSPELRRLRTAVAAIAMLLLVATASGGVFVYRLHSALTAQRGLVAAPAPARVVEGPLSSSPTASSTAPPPPSSVAAARISRVEALHPTLVAAGTTKPVAKVERASQQTARSATLATVGAGRVDPPTAQTALQPAKVTAAVPQEIALPRAAAPAEVKAGADVVSSSFASATSSASISATSPSSSFASSVTAKDSTLRPGLVTSGEGGPAGIAASFETISRTHGALSVPGDVAMRNAISTPKPYYPFDARLRDIEGNVVVEVVISKKGTVQKARAISGPSPLRANAIGAVQSWHFRPFLVNGKPNEVSTNLNIPFSLR